MVLVAIVVLVVLDGNAAAQSDEDEGRPAIELHGFVSEGGFVSTANDYIGHSSRGSLALFEAALNASAEPADRLRVGIQLFSRNVGTQHDEAPRIDWAFLDYQWRDELGLRAGVIKMPYGLHNEYADIDAARLPILLPQGLYSLRNREALLSHTGFTLYGERALGGAGSIDYQAWLGLLTIPENALVLDGATLDEIDSKYVTGAKLMWEPPVDGLRVGASYLRATIDFHLTLGADTVAQLVMAGLVPADYDGQLLITQRPTQLWVGSAEYTRGDWQLTAEYARALTHQRSSLPMILPTTDSDGEMFYAMVTRQLSDCLAVGGYYSVHHLDAGDRSEGFQRDLAATVRWDVNDHWLWKLEGHFIDGTADLAPALNPNPERYWGMFLARTTVAF